MREKKYAKLVNTRGSGANNDVIVQKRSWRPKDIRNTQHVRGGVAPAHNRLEVGAGETP